MTMRRRCSADGQVQGDTYQNLWWSAEVYGYIYFLLIKERDDNDAIKTALTHITLLRSGQGQLITADSSTECGNTCVGEKIKNTQS